MTPTTPLDPTTPVTPLRVSAPGSDRVHIADRVNAAGHPLVLCGRLRPSSALADHREVTCATCRDRLLERVLGGRCRYSLACEAHATEVIDCGPLGAVPACADCAALYARLGGGS